MFAYCRNNPVCRKDTQGTEDTESYWNDGSNGDAYNEPMDPEDMAPSTPTQAPVGQSYGTTSGGSNPGSSGPGPSTTASNGGSLSGGSSPKFTPDQQALLDLAKAGTRSGVTMDEAETLVSWANEYGISCHGPMTHPGSDGYWSNTMHIKIKNMHIAIK